MQIRVTWIPNISSTRKSRCVFSQPFYTFFLTNPSSESQLRVDHDKDEFIAAQPQRLEYYRARGIIRCFLDEYSQAIKDFTLALKETRATRKAKALHCTTTKLTGWSQSDHSSATSPMDGETPHQRERLSPTQ